VSVQNCGTAHFMISRRVLTFVSNSPAFFAINVLVCAFQPTGSSTVIQSHLLLILQVYSFATPSAITMPSQSLWRTLGRTKNTTGGYPSR